MRQIYLDNSATTRCLDEVVTEMNRVMLTDYGNPSSLHRMGIDGEKALKQARRQLARVLGAADGEIFFTSGGTEANNWAIWGTAQQRRRRGRHIVTTAVEHASVLTSAKRLAEEGFEVTYLGTDSRGIIDVNELKEVVREDTILVSIMSVNNEVGSIQPVKEAAAVAAAQAPQAVLHVDGVQSFGKLNLCPKDAGIDLMSLSAHKIHGPKGIGALYIGRGTQLAPLLVGGEQETGARAGTENVPGIVGFGRAAAAAGKQMSADSEQLARLGGRLRDGLSAMDHIRINGPEAEELRAPHIFNIWCEGVERGEVLLHSLEAEGIYVSTGSACHSRRQEVSHVLKNMGLSGTALTGSVRVSLSYLNTEEDVDYFLEKLEQVTRELRELG